MTDQTPTDWLLDRYDRGSEDPPSVAVDGPMLRTLPDHQCDALGGCVARRPEWPTAMRWTPDGPPPGRTP